MADTMTSLIRLNYFDRQQLTAADLNAEQQYFRERLRRHNRFLHGWGVVSGAAVTLGGAVGSIHVSEGYVVTPHGDEIYIPAGTQVDVSGDLNTCLGAAADPCSAVRIVDATIDPEGKDVRTNYNAEWIELLVQERMSLDGYVVQHTINPGTSQAAFVDYYTFRETKRFPFGTTIRIHSGAARNHNQPEPEILHRYVAGADQVGNWRLNNTRDTIRILNPEGVVVHTRTFASTAGQAGEGTTIAYLVACPCEQPLCPKPLVPERCQPPGGDYEWSRAREIFRLQLLCELPPSHQTPLPNCDVLDAAVCGQAHVPPPPALDPQDNGVVLATLSIQNGAINAVDNFTHRRQLLSDELMLAYLRCQCVTVEPPNAAFVAQPNAGTVPLTVSFRDQSTGQITSWAWTFGDGGTSSQRNPGHIYQAAGTYPARLTVTGPGGADTATRTITVQAETPNAAFVAEPDTGTVPLTVEFLDQSSGQITSWAWNFGDGATSSQRNPVHTYQEVGAYIVTLSVAGPGGRNIASDTITVEVAPPMAAFSAIPQSGWAPLTVSFTDQSSGAITDYRWVIAGSISNLQNPVHTFQEVGLHIVSLTVTGPGGANTTTRSVLVFVEVGLLHPSGESFLVELDENEFDLARGHGEAIEAVNGIGTVRGTRLREVGADNVLVLAALPPERTAAILGVNVDIATRLRDDALDRLRR